MRITFGFRTSGTGRVTRRNQRCEPDLELVYFQETDTVHIEFKPADVAGTRDLDENTILDLDRSGNICALTIEQAKDRTEIPQLSYGEVGQL